MNRVELNGVLKADPKWAQFAEKLQSAMTDEFRLDGVTVFLRELTEEEKRNQERDVLTFNPTRQEFEFAVSPMGRCPTAWKIADRIDHFLNPDIER